MLFLRLSCSAGHDIVHNGRNSSWRGLDRQQLEFLGKEAVGSHGCTAGGKERGEPCGAKLAYEIVDQIDPFAEQPIDESNRIAKSAKARLK